MSDLERIFSADGALAEAIPGYRLRQQQLEMAQAIQQAITDNATLVTEAGTGTGKTFAYLVPALLSGGKVIISTGTKTLQDQLFNRDLPAVRDALKAPVTIAILKGRANYVCHYHLKRAVNEGRFMSRDDAHYVHLIQRFSERSQSGDKSELPDVPENAGVWPAVTSTRDNCLGSECPDYKECFVMEARKRALAAEVVVVNHHLFFADVMLRDEGVAELLPASNTVIFDEAHQLPETAGLFFGEDLTTSYLMDLARDAHSEYLTDAKDCVELPERTAALEKAVKDFRLVFGLEGARMPVQRALGFKGFTPALELVMESWLNLPNCWKHRPSAALGWKTAGSAPRHCICN